MDSGILLAVKTLSIPSKELVWVEISHVSWEKVNWVKRMELNIWLRPKFSLSNIHIDQHKFLHELNFISRPNIAHFALLPSDSFLLNLEMFKMVCANNRLQIEKLPCKIKIFKSKFSHKLFSLIKIERGAQMLNLSN